MSDAPAIQVQGLTKDFASGLRGLRVRAVEDLSLTVPVGGVFGLLGPNGSGKSTTIKVLLGLVEPTRGHCTVFGEPAGSFAARRRVGYLPEAPYFYRYLSGRELVRFYGKLCGVPRGEIAEKADAVIGLVGLSEAADRRVGTYSKGMLQRIGLAQALVHDPDLVILDEPTAGVDPIGSAEIGELIHELKRRGKTVLLCSHLLSQVEGLCDELAILDRGRLILGGTVAELASRSESTALRLRGRLTPALREELEALLGRHEASLDAGAPRLDLDALFLSQVRRSRSAREATASDAPAPATDNPEDAR